MRRNWWKILSVLLLVYTFIYGFLVRVPDIGNLQQTIRNLFFHVPMWFAQLILITVSLVNAVMYLRKPSLELDNKSNEYAKTGIVFGLLGLITGAIWANYTWGAPGIMILNNSVLQLPF
jgi:heme exporter protein C